MDHDVNQLESALKSIASMIARSEKAQQKFAVGTSQHTLQKNRIHALYVASALVGKELNKHSAIDGYTKADLKKACAPITSLISKSEKAQLKLLPGSWQHTMLDGNLKALNMALTLLTKTLEP